MKKKYLFLSMIAAMVMALGAKAQEETYNMIIKMADGTTIFINPHDVDSISFNNGEVSVSGSNIDQLVETIKECRLRTDELETNMADNWVRTTNLITMMNNIISDLVETKCVVDENSRRIKGDAVIINPETDEPYTFYGYDSESGWGEYPLTMERMRENLLRMTDMEYMVKDLEERIESLYSPLREFLGCDYWDTWETSEKLVEFLGDLKFRLDALDGGVEVDPTVKAGLCPDGNHPHMIDLGLPDGTKWACCNVGAAKPSESGEYYAWGETDSKGGSYYYTWEYYNHCDGSEGTCRNIGNDISGTEYDVAYVRWGSPWRMPTYDEQAALLDHCTSESMSLNGEWGYKLTGSNGNSIFVPGSGRKENYSLFSGFGNLWSSTIDPDDNSKACLLWIDYYCEVQTDSRYKGLNVRPVAK